MKTSKQNNRKRDLTEGPLLSRILVFALPVMATGILQLLFNTADTIVVGRWGGATPDACETSLAAVGSCGALINLIINLFIGLSVGAGVCTAQALGAGRQKDLEKVIHTSVLTGLIAGCGVGLAGFVFARPLLALMGTDPAVIDEATLYMRAYFLGAPANMIYNYCAAILRSGGDTTHPLIFLSTAGVANVGLNLLTVLGFGIGAMGVGIATAASHWISCILILIFMHGLKDDFRFRFRSLRIDLFQLKRIVAIGLPAGLQSSLFAVSNVLIQSSVNSFGKATIAANAAANNLGDYVYIVANAFYHTVLAFVGQHAGAKKPERLRRCIFYCAACVTVIDFAFGCFVLLLGKFLLGVYIPGNAEAVAIGMVRLRIMLPTYFFCGLMDVATGILRAFGRSVRAMIISLLGACGLRILWIETIFAAHHTLEILYVSYPITWIITAATAYLFCFFAYRSFRKSISIPAKIQSRV